MLLVSQNIWELNKLLNHLASPMVECEKALDLETATKILSTRSQDVLVIDSELTNPPHEKMSDLVETLKSDFHNVRIVVFNGVSNRSVQRRIRRRGADGYLSGKNNIKKVAGSVQRFIGS